MAPAKVQMVVEAAAAPGAAPRLCGNISVFYITRILSFETCYCSPVVMCILIAYYKNIEKETIPPAPVYQVQYIVDRINKSLVIESPLAAVESDRTSNLTSKSVSL